MNSMANQEQLDMLHEGVEVWNKWRQEYPDIRIDLSGSSFVEADLSNADLRKALLSNAYLPHANLSHALLDGADLSGADLRDANLRRAYLFRADFHTTYLMRANLREADLSRAYFNATNLTGADLRGADLNRASFTGTNLEKANLTGAYVHGISVWDVLLEGAIQSNLVITGYGQPKITVDNLEVAQFIYLLLNNQRIRHVINTITSKVVLILGRFSVERKPVLDAIRNELRNYDYLPVLFDFEKPDSRDLTETISTLAHLARFIIIDLTDPSSAPHEIATIVPQCIVPVQPLLLQDASRDEYAMFSDLRRRYHWVLPTYHYLDTPSLLASLKEHLIIPAEQKAQELEQHKQGK
jgi:Pentapeptide repeats (8 copies)